MKFGEEKWKAQHEEKMAEPYSHGKSQYVENRLESHATKIAAPAVEYVVKEIQEGNLNKLSKDDVQDAIKQLQKMMEGMDDKDSVKEEAQVMAKREDEERLGAEMAKDEEAKLASEKESAQKAEELLKQIKGQDGEQEEKSQDKPSGSLNPDEFQLEFPESKPHP